MGVRDLVALAFIHALQQRVIFYLALLNLLVLFKHSSATRIVDGPYGQLRGVDREEREACLDLARSCIPPVAILNNPDAFHGPSVLIVFFYTFVRGLTIYIRLSVLDPVLCSLGQGSRSLLTCIQGRIIIQYTILVLFPPIETMIRDGRDSGLVEQEGMAINYWVVYAPAIPSENTKRNSPLQPPLNYTLTSNSSSTEGVHPGNMEIRLARPRENSVSIPNRTIPSGASGSQNLRKPGAPSEARRIPAWNESISSHGRRFPVDANGDCDLSSVALVTSRGAWSDEQSLHGLQVLNPTDKIWSPSASFYLVMQLDCNLVLYDTVSGKSLWASGTNGWGDVCFAALTLQGDLQVVDSGSQIALWSTNTYCVANGGDCWTDMILQVQNDGNLVLYIFDTVDPAWSSNTVRCNGGCDV